MSVVDLVASGEARAGFYPTPPELAERLLAGIRWKGVQGILEPSAGKGDLVLAIWREEDKEEHMSHRHSVDCIEIDPNLRAILQHGDILNGFLKERMERWKELEHRRRYAYMDDVEDLSSSEFNELYSLQEKLGYYTGTTINVISDDFLTFQRSQCYDLIVMNPPFANGDEHLLKAIQMQEETGGRIRCILNAETLRNPYTARRQLLVSKLEQYNAEIEFVSDAFHGAERGADVDVALIKIEIPLKRRESDIYKRLKKAQEVEDFVAPDVTDITVNDFLERIIRQFNLEIDAGMELIHEFVDMQPYLLSGFDGKQESILGLTILGETCGNAVCTSTETMLKPRHLVNDFVRAVREKYWTALFSSKEFVGQLTSNLQDKYRAKVDELSKYNFDMFNIQEITKQMMTEMSKGMQETIVELFDKLSCEHSWYPECDKNRHYFNGWATNKAHKINNKVILPVNGMYSSYSWIKSFDVHTVESTLSDIEKVFDYFDGDPNSVVDLHGVLQAAHDAEQNRKIQCKYFAIDIFKKGTIHIKFYDQSLVDRFNIYVCRNKNWLPPCYGYKKYTDLSEEEKETIDSFDGDGTEGSGEESYTRVFENRAFYLTEPTGKMLLLGNGVTEINTEVALHGQ